MEYSSFIYLLLLGASAEGARILVLFPLPVRSHVVAYTAFVEELAHRGHNVTVVSAFPRKSPLQNYNEIIVADTLPPRDAKGMNLFEMKDKPFINFVIFIFNVCYMSCKTFLKDPNIKKLIHSKDQEFDLIIYQSFLTECTYGLLHKFKAPTIQIVPNTIVPWNADSVGNPSTLSYIPELMSYYDRLDFRGRFLNFLRQQFVNLFRRYYVLPKMDAVLREHFQDPSIPSIQELESKTSFLFLHSNPIFSYPRPFTPNTIEVGGIHIKSPQQLPEDLKTFIDSARHGVIYFSLGTNVRSVDMPESTRKSFLKCFSKLKQKVLWKLQADHLPGLPNNVRLGKWFPQSDILAHSNVKLFISHAGLMGVEEATYFGVPMLVIPIIFDQHFNALRVQSAGTSLILDARNITEISLCSSIDEILHNPEYQENAKRLSRIMKDQPQTPMERAIFWTEYSIRHKGAPHLRSQALNLNFVQYYFLDVIALILLIGLTISVIFFMLVRIIVNCLGSKNTTRKEISQRKKKN